MHHFTVFCSKAHTLILPSSCLISAYQTNIRTLNYEIMLVFNQTNHLTINDENYVQILENIFRENFSDSYNKTSLFNELPM